MSNGSFTDYCEAQLLNHLFGGMPYNFPTVLYFGYMVGVPGETGPGAEPNFGSYERVQVNNNTVNFPITTTQSKTNATEITFEEATANHGLVQALGIWDSPVAGNLLAYFPLANPINISASDAMKIPAASLTFGFQAGGLSNYVKNAFLNALFGGVPFNLIPIIYVGYSTTAPTDAAPGTEPAVGGYSRVQVANSAQMFPASSTGVKLNALDINFPEATASQGTATHIQFFDSLSGGNYLGRYPLAPVQAISQFTIPVLGANAIQITLD
ncbi:hypothetical protein CAL7716_085420 [Calothrix sp. PCC 7716]|nr:hypothetical protein CAL7716_085420 [Calothrix sp. PCC 7716]